MLWALEIALDNHFSNNLIEGDAKLCIEAIFAAPLSIPWGLQALVYNINCFVLKFATCSSCWVPRDVNALAHSLAKFTASRPFCLLCNNTNLPPSVREVWLRDLLVVFA
jgi:hypothetical protein